MLAGVAAPGGGRRGLHSQWCALGCGPTAPCEHPSEAASLTRLCCSDLVPAGGAGALAAHGPGSDRQTPPPWPALRALVKGMVRAALQGLPGNSRCQDRRSAVIRSACVRAAL